MKRARIVEIEWTDIASGNSRWMRLPEIEALDCVSVGMLIHSCRDVLAVVQTASEDRACTDTITIPRSVVRRVRTLGISKRANVPDVACRDCGRRARSHRGKRTR